MSMGTAMTIFAKTVVKEGRIPFELSVKTPNRETIEAMLEAENQPRPKTNVIRISWKRLMR